MAYGRRLIAPMQPFSAVFISVTVLALLRVLRVLRGSMFVFVEVLDE